MKLVANEMCQKVPGQLSFPQYDATPSDFSPEMTDTQRPRPGKEFERGREGHVT